ncbi:DUF6380 family protein [Streptomyces sp. NPDC020490]
MENPVPGDCAGEKRQATLREATASLTATVCRDPFDHRGGRPGEDAR